MVGTEEEGWQVDTGTHQATMDLGYPREEEGQRTAGTGPGPKTLLRSDGLIAAPHLL